MNAKELTRVKQYQRDFEKKFGKKLYISWSEMKGFPFSFNTDNVYDEAEKLEELTPEQVLDKVVSKHGTTIEALRDRSKRIHLGSRERERNALIEFSKIIMINKMNRCYAGKLVNRDRTTIYHFAKMTNG